MRVIPTLAFLVIAATIGFAAGCGDDDDEDTAAGGGGATNDGEEPHNYTIQGLRGGDELTTGDVDPGSSGKVRLDVSVRGGTRHLEGGKWGVICTIPGHAEQGMEGTLTVE
ncbi:MAG TPA: hypothetical protein VFD47_06300 [Actinomycetota bacterium]|nr:hypothetical protein [Actinomycetota bacterium]